MLVAALLTPALLAACTDDGRPAPGATGSITFEGGATLSVRVADDGDERRRGLMGVESLPDDEGMAFDFGDQPQTGEFWMKDTLITPARPAENVAETPARQERSLEPTHGTVLNR